jgi:GNAT superfamily N-acetyltransferase
MTDDADLDFEPLNVRLRDESEVTVRVIRAEDADKLQAAIRSLSDEDRYSRFFSAMDELPPNLLDRATHPDGKRELQLVAVAGDAIVAGARYGATKIDGDCEFAIAVIESWQGRGLARLMLTTLMRTARTRGFARMDGYILATNAAMLGLARKLGFAQIDSPEGPSVCLFRRDLSTIA